MRIENVTTAMPLEKNRHLLMQRGGSYGWEAMKRDTAGTEEDAALKEISGISGNILAVDTIMKICLDIHRHSQIGLGEYLADFLDKILYLCSKK